MTDASQETAKRAEKDRDFKDPMSPKDAFALSSLMRVGNSKQYDVDFVMDAVARSSARASENNDDNEFSQEDSESRSSPSRKYNITILRKMVEETRARTQQIFQEALTPYYKPEITYTHYDPVKQMKYTYDDGERCLIKPLYEDGSSGEASPGINFDDFRRSLNIKDKRSILGVDIPDFATDDAKLNDVPIKTMTTSATVNNTRKTDVIVLTDGRRYTMSDPFTKVCGTERWMIEAVKGKDYFVGKDGRHFEVIDGKAEYLEGVSATSLLKQAEYEGKKFAYKVTGQKGADDEDNYKKIFGSEPASPKKGLSKTFDSASDNDNDAAKPPKADAVDKLKDVAADTSAKFNQAVQAVKTDPGKAVSDGWKHVTSGIGNMMGH